MTDPSLMLTRRMYLTIKAVKVTGSDIFTVTEAVSSTAIEHPEWNMDEQRTWEQWERQL